MARLVFAFIDELVKVAQFGGEVPAILGGGALGGLVGTGVGHVTGKALGKYPGQSRDYGAKAGAITGAVLGAHAMSRGEKNKVFQLLDDIGMTRQEARRHGELGKMIGQGKVMPQVRSWGRFAKRTGKAFLPEAIAAGAATALLARRRKHRHHDD